MGKEQGAQPTIESRSQQNAPANQSVDDIISLLLHLNTEALEAVVTLKRHVDMLELDLAAFGSIMTSKGMATQEEFSSMSAILHKEFENNPKIRESNIRLEQMVERHNDLMIRIGAQHDDKEDGP